MRSLLTRLILAFLIVGLAGAILVAFLVRQTTQAAFEGFVLDQGQKALASSLEQYFQAYGGWDGIGDSLIHLSPEPENIHGGSRRGDVYRVWDLFTLVGPDRIAIYSSQSDTIGKTYSTRELKKATPLQVNGETVGWLIRNQTPAEWLRNSSEWVFLQRVNRAALISALIAAALALLIGGLLAYTLTRSLRELKEVSEEIATGKLGRQVKIRSQDELGQLAVSFNQMSLDLARANQSRRQMTADIAHDLRTPLSVIAGYTEALSDGKLPGDPEVYGVLHQEAQHLRHLVDDLRLLSLADAGELRLNLQPLSPRDFLQGAAARHALAAAEKNIALRMEGGQDLPPVAGDPERLSQVFDNLIVNALRYTPSGGEIGLSARLAGEQVQFQVRDNGSGIAPQDLPNIFNRLYRADSSRQQNGESGLGLAIAKSIVEAHGGTLTVESASGQGATFTVSLPTFLSS